MKLTDRRPDYGKIYNIDISRRINILVSIPIYKDQNENQIENIRNLEEE